MLIFRSEKLRTALQLKHQAGQLLRLAPGIYSTDMQTQPEAQIRANVVPILAYLRPGAIISHRSALQSDYGASEGLVVVTDNALRRDYYVHEMPGLQVMVVPGQPPLASDNDLGGVFSSSKARAVLENLEAARVVKSAGKARTLDKARFVSILAKIAPTNTARDGLLTAAKLVNAESNGRWQAQIGYLDTALTAALRAEAARPLFLANGLDHERVRLFEELAEQLKRGIHGNEFLYGDALPDFPSRPTIDDPRFFNLAFYEAYFSNYIEGTEFTPEEARDITHGAPSPAHKPKEGHDIRALYSLYATPDDFSLADNTAAKFLENLKYWHFKFGDHEDKRSIKPGEFKDRANRVGSTYFTPPEQVEPTLAKAWEIGQTFREPIDQMIFRAVSTVAVHPFLDGNGRITRLAASNILGRAGKLRVMIPTVFREDYLLSLQAFSNGDVIPVIRMYRRAAEMAKSVPFESDFESLTRWLANKNAFCAYNEAKWDGPIPTRRSMRKGP